jgi:hypothetical protein
MGFRYSGYDVVKALNLAVDQFGVPECIRGPGVHLQGRRPVGL